MLRNVLVQFLVMKVWLNSHNCIMLRYNCLYARHLKRTRAFWTEAESTMRIAYCWLSRLKDRLLMCELYSYMRLSIYYCSLVIPFFHRHLSSLALSFRWASFICIYNARAATCCANGAENWYSFPVRRVVKLLCWLELLFSIKDRSCWESVECNRNL